MARMDLLGSGGFDNVCSCGREFKGDVHPDMKIVDKDDSRITLVAGDNKKGKMVFSPAVVKDGCADCKKRLAEEAEANYYAELDALPVEERLRRIEKWIRNFKHQELRHIPPPLY